MFGLFGKSRFLDDDVEDWCLETWAWLMTNLGGMDRLRRTEIVLPTREFFPPTLTEGHERAQYVLDLVKGRMGMNGWPCELEAYDRPEARHRVGLYAMVQRGQTAAGTFEGRDGKVVISYASDLVAQPRRLIATLAHELAHYLLATVKAPIPGGDELHELTTELTVAYAGFGVIAANAAFNFEQHQDVFGQGCSSNRSGYFSEPTWAFALALFSALKGAQVPHKQLKDSVATLCKKATRYLERNESLLAPLRSIP